MTLKRAKRGDGNGWRVCLSVEWFAFPSNKSRCEDNEASVAPLPPPLPRCCCWQPHQEKVPPERHREGEWAWHMCQDKINVPPKAATTTTTHWAALSTLNCCSLDECCRGAAILLWFYRKSNRRARERKPVLASIARRMRLWLDKKYAIFENYAQCISLACSRRCSSNAGSKLKCAALLAGERSLASERTLRCEGSYARCRSRWIQFEFWLRSVQTCSEKPENHSSDKRYNQQK